MPASHCCSRCTQRAAAGKHWCTRDHRLHLRRHRLRSHHHHHHVRLRHHRIRRHLNNQLAAIAGTHAIFRATTHATTVGLATSTPRIASWAPTAPTVGRAANHPRHRHPCFRHRPILRRRALPARHHRPSRLPSLPARHRLPSRHRRPGSLPCRRTTRPLLPQIRRRRCGWESTSQAR